MLEVYNQKTLNLTNLDNRFIKEILIKDTLNQSHSLTLQIGNTATTTLLIPNYGQLQINLDYSTISSFYLNTNKNNILTFITYSLENPYFHFDKVIERKYFDYLPSLIYVIGGLILFFVILFFIDFLRRTIR